MRPVTTISPSSLSSSAGAAGAAAGVVVLDYSDQPVGSMIEESDGGGQFIEVTLNPTVLVAEASMVEKAQELHGPAHTK